MKIHTARTTAIGSLPHANLDSALEYAFRLDVPFLPQIPIRNPWEFMIPQALEGLPGLELDDDGAVALNVAVWETRQAHFEDRLNAAIRELELPMDRPTPALEGFEPSAATSSTWQAFAWELEERREGGKPSFATAKIQIAGPLTTQWVLRTKAGEPIGAQVQAQISKLLLARVSAMARRLRTASITPLVFLDEPGMYAFSPELPKHRVALQELKLIVRALKNQGAQVGVHCCGNTHWPSLLESGIDWLSIDVLLSLDSALEQHRPAFETFLDGGGRLSLGVIPTGRASLVHSFTHEYVEQMVLGILRKHWKAESESAGTGYVKKVLAESLYTPACGLALLTPADAEYALELLQAVTQGLAQGLATKKAPT